MAASAIVLYEDTLGPNKEFGLHKFLVRCAFDHFGDGREAHYHLSNRIEPRPMNGNTKVLASLKRDLLSFGDCKVIAILDNDKIREALKLASTATDDDVKQAILPDLNQRDNVVIGLLKQNTESILRAARDCAADVEAEHLENAIAKKQLLARDIVFKKISSAANRQVRDCIQEKIPSLSPLTTAIGQVFERLFLDGNS